MTELYTFSARTVLTVVIDFGTSLFQNILTVLLSYPMICLMRNHFNCYSEHLPTLKNSWEYAILRVFKQTNFSRIRDMKSLMFSEYLLKVSWTIAYHTK